MPGKQIQCRIWDMCQEPCSMCDLIWHSQGLVKVVITGPHFTDVKLWPKEIWSLPQSWAAEISTLKSEVFLSLHSACLGNNTGKSSRKLEAGILQPGTKQRGYDASFSVPQSTQERPGNWNPASRLPLPASNHFPKRAVPAVPEKEGWENLFQIQAFVINLDVRGGKGKEKKYWL